MRIFRSVFVIAYANLSRWKRDYRVWLILAFVGFIIVNSLKGYVQYGMAENKKMTFCVLPMLFQATDISLKSPKILVYVGYLLLLCDAPFMYNHTQYMILRSGRKKWWKGECTYIFIVSFLYTFYIMLVSSATTLPAVSLENDWGEVFYDFLYGTAVNTVNDLLEEYTLEIGQPARAVNMLLPFFCQAYAFFVGMFSFFTVGLVMYLVNLKKGSITWGLMAGSLIVFADPVLTSFAKPADYWLQAFSPVCWSSVECNRLLGYRFFVSTEYVVITFSISIMILLALIACVSRRVLIEKKV